MKDQIRFVLSCDDRLRLEAAAEANGITMSAWIRKAVEFAMAVDPGKPVLRQQLPKANLWIKIAAADMELIRERAAELGIGRPATFVRYAVLYSLDLEQVLRASRRYEERKKLADAAEKILAVEA